MMRLNSFFVANIRSIYGETGERWLNELPNYIELLSSEWQFHFQNPLSDLSYSFVGLVRMDVTGNTAIIKMVPGEGSLVSEVKWLNSIAKGAPTVYSFHEKLNAYLMEHLEPGKSLKQLVKAGEGDKATRIICQAIRDLQSQQHTEFAFQHVSELAKALPILKGRYDAKLLSQAQSWFHDLTLDRKEDKLLHGDLHHDNILSSDAGWKVIDPHGYVGDPAAEVGAMIRNPFDCFPKERALSKVIERRLSIMADELPFDAQRIKAWAFCMTVLSAAWILEDQKEAKESDLDMDIAMAINKAKI